MLELGMVSSFHPHSMCKRVERVTAKTGRTSCTNWTISFGYLGFGRELICYTSTSMFLNLFELQPIFAFSMQHSQQRHQLPTRSEIICSFQSFTDLFRELNDREIENHYKMNSKNVRTWHGIIISPA